MSSPDQQPVDPNAQPGEPDVPLAEIGAAVLRVLLTHPDSEPAVIDLPGVTIGMSKGEVVIDTDVGPTRRYTVEGVVEAIRGSGTPDA